MVPRQPFNEMKPNSGWLRAKAGGSAMKNRNRHEVCQQSCAIMRAIRAFLVGLEKMN
jgi:hypothetical protein